MPGLSRAVASAAATSLAPTPVRRAGGATYMPKTKALWRAFARRSNSTPTAPTSACSTNAPSTISLASGATDRRDSHQWKGSAARSSIVDVNASGCCA